jgi:deoxycytidylate deaminase
MITFYENVDFDDKKFVALAEAESELSPDRSTKTGALIVRDGIIVARGFNRL